MKNKIVLRDKEGMRWFMNKAGYVFPTNWKVQAWLVAAQAETANLFKRIYKRNKTNN